MNTFAKPIEAIYWDNLLFLARARQGGVVQDTPDLLLIDSGLPCDAFNRIGRCAIHPRFGAARIEEAINHFRKKQEPTPFTWTVGPAQERAALEETLTGFGLTKAADTVGMVLPLKDFKFAGNIPETLDIKRVETKKHLEDFAGIVSGSSKPPNPHVGKFYTEASNAILMPTAPMKLFIGYAAGAPAATVESFYAQGGVGLTNIIAAASMAGKGYAPAMMVAALREAKRSEQTFAFVQADTTSKAFYERIGFKPAALFSDYRIASH